MDSFSSTSKEGHRSAPAFMEAKTAGPQIPENAPRMLQECSQSDIPTKMASGEQEQENINRLRCQGVHYLPKFPHMYTRIDNYYLLPVNVVRTVAATLSLVLLFGFNRNRLAYSRRQHDCQQLKELNAEVYTWTGAHNQLPVQVRKVALEVLDTDRYGMHAGKDWASIFPLGMGFVKGGDDFYAVSMYHQLHCLNSFRRMFNGPRNTSSEHDTAHILHCLTYMRQMLLCNADITLEPAFRAINTDGRKTVAAYGTEVTHQCRDWTQIREFVEGNYATWEQEESGFRFYGA